MVKCVSFSIVWEGIMKSQEIPQCCRWRCKHEESFSVEDEDAWMKNQNNEHREEYVFDEIKINQLKDNIIYVDFN